MSARALDADVDRYYARRADALAALYDSVTFADVHAGLLPFLPAIGASVLDVGSGSGRDALALAYMGYRVTAVEPSSSFRRHAIARDGEGCVRWIGDHLPGLASLMDQRGQFGFILCSGVLMHMPASALVPSVATLAGLLSAEGRLALSVRRPLPDEPREVFREHASSAVIAAGRRGGLFFVCAFETTDALGRDDRRWVTFVFAARKPFADASGAAA